MILGDMFELGIYAQESVENSQPCSAISVKQILWQAVISTKQLTKPQ
jgi:hypothetical protein